MRESRTRFELLHLTPIFLSAVLVSIDARPLVLLDIVNPERVLYIVVSLVLVLT